jgi:hypothetical protein
MTITNDPVIKEDNATAIQIPQSTHPIASPLRTTHSTQHDMHSKAAIIAEQNITIASDIGRILAPIGAPITVSPMAAQITAAKIATTIAALVSMLRRYVFKLRSHANPETPRTIGARPQSGS